MSIRYIDKDEELSSVVRHLESTDQIAIDLEFDRNRYRYGFNLCLIQLFDGEDCHLIDPLSDEIQTEMLFPVLENSGIEKVAFAFQEDHRLLHYIGCRPKNIFDLRIASQLLNHPPASLTNIVEDVLDVHMGKSSQDSNWFKRPLKQNQIQYAAKDVLHLFDLKESLLNSMNGSEIMKWIREENGAWDQIQYDGSDINNYIKEKDKRGLSETEWHVFKALMTFREEIAESSNRPSYQIFSKKLIYKIIEDPSSVQNWTEQKGVFRRIKNRHYQNKIQKLIKQVLKEAENLGLSPSAPARKSPTSEEMNQINLRKQKIQRAKNEFFGPIKEKISEDYGNEVSTYLFSNRTISEIVMGNNGSLEKYKRDLLNRYASELNLNPEHYLS
ncbi:ribonuclease D [Rhodohalobacter halophilus]|uniref:ribonuclease D n=1 Tax=Rhodohalobacter halophilus TaxID=1812810 RepID=UPI00083F9BDC|nr:ribonuclease D [Rhodohalobacter halophilus]